MPFNRQELLKFFKDVEATEANWAVEVLMETSGQVSTEDLKRVSDCLCKINDHGNLPSDVLKKTEDLELNLVKQLYPLALGVQNKR